MICDEIRRLAYFYLDGAVSSSKAANFESHLNHCPDCGTRLAVHKRVREFVKVRLRPVPAPDHLRARIQKTCRGCE